MPALTTLRLEVLTVTGKLPAYYSSKGDLRLPRDSCQLNFGDGAVCQVNFGANLNYLTSELMVSASPRVQLQTQAEPLSVFDMAKPQ